MTSCCHHDGKQKRHSTITLNNGKVLVSGGGNASGSLASCELYDPVSNTWTYTDSLNQARLDHQMLLLQNGRVLAVGSRVVNGLVGPNQR